MRQQKDGQVVDAEHGFKPVHGGGSFGVVHAGIFPNAVAEPAPFSPGEAVAVKVPHAGLEVFVRYDARMIRQVSSVESQTASQEKSLFPKWSMENHI